MGEGDGEPAGMTHGGEPLEPKIELQRLDPAQRRFVARELGDEIVRRARIEGRDGLDLYRALVHFNVMLAGAMESEEAARYLPEHETGDFTSRIVVGMQCRNPRYVRVLARELANHLQHTWVAPALYGAEIVVCTGQDNESARQEISRLVVADFFEQDEP